MRGRKEEEKKKGKKEEMESKKGEEKERKEKKRKKKEKERRRRRKKEEGGGRRAGKISPWLRTLATLEEDLESFPSTHGGSQTSTMPLPGGFAAPLWLPVVLHVCGTPAIHGGKTLIHTK